MRTATERVADFTIGTAIVMVHLVLADRQRRRALPAGRPSSMSPVHARVHA